MHHAHLPKSCFLSRDISLLAFNRRVLAQARYADVPLLERLRYITIVSSNLDEFFEVRFADLLNDARHSNTRAEMATISLAAHELINEQYDVFNHEVMPALRQEGILILSHEERTSEQKQWVQQFFATQVYPLLVPIGLDPAHPFPQVANKSLNFIVALDDDPKKSHGNHIAIVRVPRALPRVIALPKFISNGKQCFVKLSSVIRAHLADLFPGRTLKAFSQFRVTRDSDLDVDEDEVQNLRTAVRTGLSTRHYGQAIRLEVVKSCPSYLSDILQEHFHLPDESLYRVQGPVNLVRLTQLIDQVKAPHLRFKPYVATWPKALDVRGSSIMAQMRERDIIMHHPFESFEPVIEWLREAVYDPHVLSIRQTVYRTGGDSELMHLLIEAAKRGKEVLAVVELKARFDEEANINWAERLEAVGAQVVYGMVGLKTHAKMLLITRREGNARSPKLKQYLHLSTGNYNASTAKLYTDIGLLTCHPQLTSDAEAVFRQLASLAELPPLNKMLSAPTTLHSTILNLIERCERASIKGYSARVVIKCNALTEVKLIEALIKAAQAGTSIDLIIRGACMLAPGVHGYTDNIRIRSVIGRFLEHSRIFYFRWGDSKECETLYLSSADWMSRNMLRRIELAWPILDHQHRQTIIDECLIPYLYDERGSWILQNDGIYKRLQPNGISAHAALMGGN